MTEQENHENNEFLSINQMAMESANAFLKHLAILNGGAAVAVLSFLAAISDTASARVVSEVAIALKWFAFGAVLAVSDLGLAYLTNYMLLGSLNARGQPKENFYNFLKRGFHILAVMFSVFSIGLFLMGVWAVSNSFLEFGQLD